MLPYLAQGANSSLEDGAVIGGVLSYISSKEQVRQAISTYENLRKARGEAIVKQTFEQRDSFHMPDGADQEKRDALFRSQLGKEIDCKFPSRWSVFQTNTAGRGRALTCKPRTCPQVQPWLYGYDAYEEVEAAVLASGRRKVAKSSDSHAPEILNRL
jgi:salicylate hydroxylase